MRPYHTGQFLFRPSPSLNSREWWSRNFPVGAPWDPLSLQEAMRRPDWPEWDSAIKIELDALKKAGTWEIVKKPENRNIVKCKWVFRVKKDAAGNIERHKARLVAKGFTQIQGPG
jgi:hypothetical protein